MRLSSHEIDTIRQKVSEIFGNTAQVKLFGSRVDDNARGGDIDLLVETTETRLSPFNDTLALETALQLALGDQKVDILLKHGGNEDSPFHQMARATGILL